MRLMSINPGADLKRLAGFFHKHVWHYLLSHEWRALRRHVESIEPELAKLLRPDHVGDPGWEGAQKNGEPLTDDEWRPACADATSGGEA
jgi:hypothetical protein